MKKEKPFVIKTCGDALKVIKSIKKHIPDNEKGTYLVIPKRLFRKLKISVRIKPNVLQS